MLRRRFVRLLTGSAGVIYAGCSDRGSQRGPIRLRVSSLPRISMSPLYLTHEQGYFSDVGLDVTIRQIKVSYQVTPLLAGRQLDISCLGLNPALFNIVASGAQVRLVLCRGIFSPLCPLFGSIYGNRRVFPKGLNDLRLLKDKRVSISGKGSNSEFYLDSLLASAGLSANDVRVVSMPEPEGVAAVASGRIDALVSSDLDKSADNVSSKVVRGIGLADILPDFQYAFMGFGPTLLERDREIGVRFLTAYLQGAKDFVNGKTPKFLDDLARVTRMDPELVRSACREMYVPSGDVDRRSLEIYRDWAVSKGYCPEGTPIADLFDATYLEEARRKLGQEPKKQNV